MVQIVPTILVKTLDEFEERIKSIENDFPLAQIDVMDGRFVPNTTFFDIEKINSIKTSLNYELHLMVENPLEYIYAVKENKKIKKIFFHFEAVKDFNKVFDAIHSFGFEAGIAINQESEVDEIKEYMHAINTLLIMGIYPGFGGQKFIPQTIEKIKKIREFSKSINIEVDGGVNDKTVKEIVEAGANILAVGSFIYQGNPKEQKERLLKAINF